METKVTYSTAADRIYIYVHKEDGEAILKLTVTEAQELRNNLIRAEFNAITATYDKKGDKAHAHNVG